MTVESEITSLLTALLRVSPDMLKAHRTEVIPVLETIAERVGVTVIQNSSSVSYRQTAPPALQYTASEERSSISSVSDGSTQQTSADVVTIGEVVSISSPASVRFDFLPSVNNGSPQETFNTLEDANSIRPQQLLDKIQENLEKIVKFFTNNSANIIESVLAPLAVEDDRLHDIKTIVGKSKPTLNDRYIQCLAQRSLALEYNQWDLKRHQAGGTRLDDVSKNASSAKSKKNGGFTFYVKYVRRFDDSQTAYKALKRGVRQLMTEGKCEFAGIEVVIPFTYRYFDALSYDELHTFVLLLQQKTEILHTLKQASSWVEDSQSIYNGYRKGKRRQLESESSLPRTKRPRRAAQHIIPDIGSQFPGRPISELPVGMRNPENSSAHSSYAPEYSSEPQNSTALYERSLTSLNGSMQGQPRVNKTNNATSGTEITSRHNVPTTDETFDHALNTTPLSQASRGPGETDMWNICPETRQERSDSRSFPPQYGMGDAWADTLQTRECFMTAGMQLPQYGIPDASAGGYLLADSALIANSQVPQYGVPDASAGILSLPHPINSHRQELAFITDTQIPQYGISNASAGGTTALYAEN
ncbi:hypothetical protein ACJ73_03987 [Blastomyces percursus]|uniref:Uncharacterized protein n=1 Tax=Blastomyces percursus TaxID=1658174 RepID=A0A1J9QWP1_9EURO|nr:hypothetical protein ACJ73_03987 [Blastomyces percursus]